MDDLFAIKMGVLQCHKKIKDLAIEMEVDYTKLIRILNRFEKVPDGFIANAKRVIQSWKGEQNGFNEHE